MISVVIIEDHEIVRTGIRHFLETEEGIRVAGEAGTAADALEIVRRELPDVVIVDLDLPDMYGIQVIESIKNSHPDVAIMVLTMYDSEDIAMQALRAGAKGFIIKGASTEEIPLCIKSVHDGKIYITNSIKDRMLQRQLDFDSVKDPLSLLSSREIQVLIEIANGHSIARAAERLCLSESSVKTYKKRVQEKLGITSVADLVRFCIKNGLVK